MLKYRPSKQESDATACGSIAGRAAVQAGKDRAHLHQVPPSSGPSELGGTVSRSDCEKLGSCPVLTQASTQCIVLSLWVAKAVLKKKKTTPKKNNSANIGKQMQFPALGSALRQTSPKRGEPVTRYQPTQLRRGRVPSCYAGMATAVNSA